MSRKVFRSIIAEESPLVPEGVLDGSGLPLHAQHLMISLGPVKFASLLGSGVAS